MPFDPLQRSANAGRPEELYEFTSADKSWRYTSADKIRVLEGFQFHPVQKLRRTETKQDKGGGDDAITLTCPADLEVAWQFRVIVPARTIWLRILKRHRGDGDHFVQSWYGRVRGVSWKNGRAQVECDGLNSLFKRSGLRLDFDTKCPHMLYGPGCNLDKDQWRLEGPVLEVGAKHIRSQVFASKPNQWLRLGYVEYGNYFYTISDHVGDRITLFTGLEISEIERPLLVTAYAGCDRTLDTCWDKFNNGLNSEANFLIPNKNPFESGL